MNEKKPYTPPKVYQVELNQEQAILTTCSAGVTAVSNNRVTVCKAGTCKRANSGGDNAAHPS